MDSVLTVVLVVVIITLLVGAAFLPRWVRRSSTAAGARAGARFTAERMTQLLTELGTTLRIQAPPEVAAALLHAAVAGHEKAYAVLDDGTVGIRFVEPDDTVVRLGPDAEGTLLRVETFRDYLGFPQTAPLWRELRERVTGEAAARRIEVSDGPVSVFERGDLLDDRNARWFRRA